MPLEEELLTSSLEAERNFCASVFYHPDWALDSCSWLNPDNFHGLMYGDFWRKVLDGKSVSEAAIELNLVWELSGVDMPFVMFPEEFAKPVSELAYMRKAYYGINEVARSLMNGDAQDVRRQLISLSEERISGISKVITPEQIDFEFRGEVRNPKSFIKTNISGIDKGLGGFYGGELIVLAARPGMGKSALVLNIAKNVAFSGKKVLFFSLEMDATKLWGRIVMPSAEVSWHDVRLKNVGEKDYQKIEHESRTLVEKVDSNLLIQDDTFSVEEILQVCLDHKPDFVVIDQLPDIHWHDVRASELEWYGKACKFIRRYISKGLSIPVVLVHQLSRGVEDRDDRRPVLKDLRWSGEVEQRADVVIMLYREDYYDSSRAGSSGIVNMEVLVRKNREGATGTFAVNYDLRTQYIF